MEEEWNQSQALVRNITESQFLRKRLDMSTEYFIVPEYTTTTTRPIPVQNQPPHVTKTACVNCASSAGEYLFAVFRNEVWVIPVLTIAGIVMLLIFGFELFILTKASRRTSSRRHLFLGQVLLLGLFLCALVSIVIAASPTQITCAVLRMGIGVAYTIVFASLLVKCVFLISLNSGVYLPATYQALLLLFSVLIQVAIGVQWLITNPPDVENIVFDRLFVGVGQSPVNSNNNGGGKKHNLLFTAKDLSRVHQQSNAAVPRCKTSYVDLLFSLVYVIFLILFVCVLAFKARTIRSNYRESTYIGLSIACTLPIFLLWISGGFIIADRYRDASIAVGLVTTAALIFVLMYMPKGRQLSAIGKDGIYKEDREDQFSSISRTGSRYSPSFFHFKPVMKYSGGNGGPFGSAAGGGGALGALGGLGGSHCMYQKHHQHAPSTIADDSFTAMDDHNLYTTLEPTLSSNPNVYFQCSNGVHPGMIY